MTNASEVATSIRTSLPACFWMMRQNTLFFGKFPYTSLTINASGGIYLVVVSVESFSNYFVVFFSSSFRRRNEDCRVISIWNDSIE